MAISVTSDPFVYHPVATSTVPDPDAATVSSYSVTHCHVSVESLVTVNVTFVVPP